MTIPILLIRKLNLGEDNLLKIQSPVSSRGRMQKQTEFTQSMNLTTKFPSFCVPSTYDILPQVLMSLNVSQKVL